MSDEAVIILDPVNADLIRDGLARGLRTFAGGNCTVSLMLMAVGALFKAGLVEWMTTMTYQAASGAGAAKMLELVKQMECSHRCDPRASPSENALEVDRMMIEAQRSPSLPAQEFGAPLAGSLIPWIDEEMPGGQTSEEWKGMAETNKILGLASARAGGRHLRARGNHALPQPGAVHQADHRRAAGRNRADAGRRKSLGARDSQ